MPRKARKTGSRRMKPATLRRALLALKASCDAAVAELRKMLPPELRPPARPAKA